MSVFIRRFLLDPGNSILLNIESVNILDLEPPNPIAGVGTGTVLFVAEFEDGPYNTVTQVGSTTDLSQNFGSLGYNYGGIVGNYPCAVQRFADGALAGEYWNGNGAVQLNGKQFAALVLCRVNTSIGTVTFTALPFVTGAAAFTYVLASGQVLGLDVGAGPQTATFTGTAATVTSGAQTFPTTFAGGEQVTFGYDQAANFTVTFLSTDQTQAQVIARINQYAGFAFTATVTSTTMSLTGLQKGNQAQVRVVSASAPGVLTALGLTVATTFGTGNVANILAAKSAEITTIVQAAVANTRVEVDQNGALRISKTTGLASDFVEVTSATTAAALGFVAGQVGTVLGVAAVLGAGASFPTGTAGTFNMSYDNRAPFTVTVATSQSAATVIASINTAAGATIAYADGTQIAIVGKAPGGNVNFISATAPAVLTQLGFSFGQTNGVALPSGSIPAGTVVQDAGMTNILVTAQSVTFTPTGAFLGGVDGTAVAVLGPWAVPVRYAVDNDTGAGTGAGNITRVPVPPLLFSLNCVNLQAIQPAMSESAIDAAYVAALANTLNPNTVAKVVNVSWSARQSNAVRRAMRANALQASASGLFGRFTTIRPPLGTTESAATSTVAEPGVGAYRDQRVAYCYPGFSTFVPIIAARGTSGGLGFTSSGNVDVGSDGFLASILSQLPPEENPGQDTSYTSAVVSLESSPVVQSFELPDYQVFKAAGICAARMDDGVAIFQSGVTSVDPSVYPGLARISRRRMADFIQDSLALVAKPYGKKLSTNNRRNALTTEIRSFMTQLLNVSNPNGQRIAGFTVDAISGNTPDTLALGLFRVIVNVRTLASLDSIVLQTTVGESVQVIEVAPAQAA